MARITLKSRWDSLEEKIKELSDQRLELFFQDNFKPDVIYECNRFGEIDISQVEAFRVTFEGKHRFKPSYNGKSPTRVDLENLQDYYERAINEKSIVWVSYITKHDTFTTSGSVRYTDIGTEYKHMAFHQSDLEELSLKSKELYAPRAGYEPCKYCGVQTLPEKMISKTIIGRGRRDVWNSRKKRYESKACLTHEPLKFCSAQCAAHEQMSREG